jgi:hypothetical protein
MHKLELDPVITENEVSEIERISQESIADDPVTYYKLLNSLKNCMDSLKVQIKILETAETRLMVPLDQQIKFKGKIH